ncbi:hypothetical protein HMPREF0262_03467 [Clostridium sp. ATCC 29733]|nr:hypothetical protein HMPREF0262_03467 [Clostridium sp. ATCC 29733]
MREGIDRIFLPMWGKGVGGRPFWEPTAAFSLRRGKLFQWAARG